MKHILFGSLLLLLFTACSPRIGTMITKTYPSLSSDSPVVVYLYQTEIPSGTESLGKVKVSDTGFTVNCSYETVLNHIKNEARKIGGNAVFIADHLTPSIFGSSCHQMTAIILRVTDFDQANDSEDNSADEFTEVQNNAVVIKPTLPKFKIGANIGYGWRTASLSNLDNDHRIFYEKMMSNIIWDGSFHYYFNDMYGVGLVYAPYYASNSAPGYLTAPVFETGILYSKSRIMFIGPVFAMRAATNDNKWFFNLSMGIGYLGYHRNETMNRHYLKENGATAGFHWSLGGEYKFDKNWGIGADFTMIGGLLNQLNINVDGETWVEKYDPRSGIGLGQFRLTTGLRYYF